MAFRPTVRSEDLRETFAGITEVLKQIRRQQLELEAQGTVTRLALGALLRTVPEEARAAVAARLAEPAGSLLGPDLPPDSPLGRAVLEEAARLASALAAPR
jgi:hypothetical protein